MATKHPLQRATEKTVMGLIAVALGMATFGVPTVMAIVIYKIATGSAA